MPVPYPDFHPVEQNLRQSFRALAAGREKGAIPELPGVTIASLGVRFQMFNAAFLSGPVDGPGALELRLEVAREHFKAEGRAWSLWVCEDWLSWTAKRRLSKVCAANGLRPAAEMPGMVAWEMSRPARHLPKMEIRRLATEAELNDFRKIGALCFRVPEHWFAEVFDPSVLTNRQFECWVGYMDGEPVATAATVPLAGSLGLYNIATVPGMRGRGVGEAITRYAADDARQRYGNLPLVLQATTMGVGLYERLGFRSVTRIVAYVSG